MRVSGQSYSNSSSLIPKPVLHSNEKGCIFEVSFNRLSLSSIYGLNFTFPNIHNALVVYTVETELCLCMSGVWRCPYLKKQKTGHQGY